jgi:hypothetical protein
MTTDLGITGTRFGATQKQKETLLDVFLKLEFEKFHHGKCRGVDCEAGGLIKKFKPDVKIVLHPPIKTDDEGEAEGDEIRVRKSHFARNRDIVDECGALIVVPKQSEWQTNGGTWYTHDYALKKGKPVLIIWPDGSIEKK